MIWTKPKAIGSGIATGLRSGLGSWGSEASQVHPGESSFTTAQFCYPFLYSLKIIHGVLCKCISYKILKNELIKREYKYRRTGTKVEFSNRNVEEGAKIWL